MLYITRPPRYKRTIFFFVVIILSIFIYSPAASAERDPCPSPGTVAVRNDGIRLVFTGEDPVEDGLCLVRIGETDRRLLFGFWTPIGPELQEPRAALWRLLSGGPGTTVTIREYVVTDSWVETWERKDEEVVRLASGPRRAIRLERTMRLHGPSGFRADASYWIDADTGVMLRATHRHIEGMRLPYRDITVTHLDTRD